MAFYGESLDSKPKERKEMGVRRVTKGVVVTKARESHIDLELHLVIADLELLLVVANLDHHLGGLGCIPPSTHYELKS